MGLIEVCIMAQRYIIRRSRTVGHTKYINSPGWTYLLLIIDKRLCHYYRPTFIPFSNHDKNTNLFVLKQCENVMSESAFVLSFLC